MRLNLPSKLKTALHYPIRAKLIFNPGSGQSGDSPQQLVTILSEMQRQNILPEVYLTTPESRLDDVVQHAIKAGIHLIVVAGGDGTIDSLVGAMVGTEATLGIIPTGTRNNVAFNLGITGDIASSVAILRHGHRLKIDVGRVHTGHARHWFLEAAAMGLISDLYPMADNFQHGDLGQIGGFLSTLVSATPSSLKINLDGDQHLTTTAHMLLVANLSMIGPHFQISPDVSFKDGELDVFTFSDMNKLQMISYVMLSNGGLVEAASIQAGIQHYRAKHITIVSDPPMPVLADGVLLGQGSLSIHVHESALRVMAGTELTGQPATPAVDNPELRPDDEQPA